MRDIPPLCHLVDDGHDGSETGGGGRIAGDHGSRSGSARGGGGSLTCRRDSLAGRVGGGNGLSGSLRCRRRVGSRRRGGHTTTATADAREGRIHAAGVCLGVGANGDQDASGAFAPVVKQVPADAAGSASFADV